MNSAPSAPETRVGPLVYPPLDLHYEAIVIDYALADEIRYREVAECLRFRDWNFVVERRDAAVFLRVEFDEYDHVYDERVTVKRQRGRDWYLRPGLTESEVVLTAWAAVEMAVVHEAREQFTYSLKGDPRRILGPHVDVRELHRIARKVDYSPPPEATT